MPTTLCPHETMLYDLFTGRIGELDETSITQHLLTCEPCREKLGSFQTECSDSVLQSLRASDRSSQFHREPDCQWATTRALGVLVGNENDETANDLFDLPMDMGDYRIVEPIAQGGMGIVYRAQHLRLGRDVAIKIIAGKRLSDRRAVQRFEAEMRTLGQLSHPHIVTALDARELNGQPVLIMEYVDGLDLSKVIDRLGPLPTEVVAAIGRAVAAALAYASRNGLIHRDIKPSNIMINTQGEVKLLDLGLARLQVSQGAETDGTITGLALGTADYMSPEQVHDARDVDVRADLYSLGCTLFKLVTGQAPYSGPQFVTNFAKLAAHVSTNPIQIPSQFKESMPMLAELIERLLAKDREARPATAQEVSLALASMSDGADLAQVVRLAQEAPRLKPIASSERFVEENIAIATASHSRRWFPPWLRFVAAGSLLPIGVAFGIWLNIQRPNGEKHRVQIPDGSAAQVDSEGNVTVALNEAVDATSSSKSGEAASSIGWSTLAVPRNANAASDPTKVNQTYEIRPSNGGNLNIQSSRSSIAEIAQMEAKGSPSSSEPNLGTSNSSGKSNSINDLELNQSMQNALKQTAPTYRGFSFHDWLHLFRSDRNIDISIVAARALINLTDDPQQKREVAKLLLEKCRTYGGRVMDENGSDPSYKWMHMFYNEFRVFVPEPGIEAIAEELESANGKSFQACGMLLASSLQSNSLDLPLLKRDWCEQNRNTLKKLTVAIGKAAEKFPMSIYGNDHDNALPFKFAVLAGMDFASLPHSMKEYAKIEWESLAMVPTSAIVRSDARYYDPQGIVSTATWRLYWEQLPTESRSPLRIMHQLFQDQARPTPELNSKDMLVGVTEVKPDDKLLIKQFILQRLADSDFDQLRDRQHVIWPIVFDWCVQHEVVSRSVADEAQKLFRETESAIIRVVGQPLYANVVARQGNAQGYQGMGMGGGGMELPPSILENQSMDITTELKESVEKLAELFELPEEMREVVYRIPNAGSGRKLNVGGGMF